MCGVWSRPKLRHLLQQLGAVIGCAAKTGIPRETQRPDLHNWRQDRARIVT
jgi:hypothetical protein